jgi:AAA domain
MLNILVPEIILNGAGIMPARRAEFCDACRRYRYIGLCYGAPGVGKTLSARYYANWENIEANLPARDASTEALTALLKSHTVFYTPPVVNTPAQAAAPPTEVGASRSDITRGRNGG